MHNFLHENADKEPPDSVNKREDSQSRIKPQNDVDLRQVWLELELNEERGTVAKVGAEP